MEKSRYKNINEVIRDVEKLGDWKDPKQKNAYFELLSKITVIYNGYSYTDKNGKEIKGYYPSEVTDAIIEACKEKIAGVEEAFDEKGELKEGYPEYSNYIQMMQSGSGISLLGERTSIDKTAKKEYGIDVYDKETTKEEVDELIKSSKKYLEKIKGEKNNSEENNRTEKDDKGIEATIKELEKEDKVISRIAALSKERKEIKDEITKALEKEQTK